MPPRGRAWKPRGDSAGCAAPRVRACEQPTQRPERLPLTMARPSINPMPSTTEILRNVPIFKDLDEAEIQSVAEVCKEEKFESGAYIFKEAEPGNRLYIIVTGEV